MKVEIEPNEARQQLDDKENIYYNRIDIRQDADKRYIIEMFNGERLVDSKRSAPIYQGDTLRLKNIVGVSIP